MDVEEEGGKSVAWTPQLHIKRSFPLLMKHEKGQGREGSWNLSTNLGIPEASIASSEEVYAD